MSLTHRLHAGHLGIIALTLGSQLGAYWGYVVPHFSQSGYVSPFPFDAFCLLALATGCVAVGAALLSCYFASGEEGETMRGMRLSRRGTIIAHHSLNLVAALLALYVGLRDGRLMLALLFPVAAGAVWFYFTLYKYQLWFSTLMVVLSTVSVPGLVLLHTVGYANAGLWQEIALGQLTLRPMVGYLFFYMLLQGGMSLLVHWVSGLGWFVRMEHLGRNTLATSLGLRRGRLVTALGYVGMLSVLLVLRDRLPAMGTGEEIGPIAYWIGIGGLLVASLLVLLTAEKGAHYRLALGTLWAASIGVVLSPLFGLIA